MIAVIVGGVYYVINNYETAINYLFSIKPVLLVICFLFIIGLRVLNVDLVQRSLVIIGWKPNFKRAFALVSISQLGKYVPGGIWQFVARFGAYKDNQISNKAAGKSFLIENLWMVGGAFFCSLAFLVISIPDEVIQGYGVYLPMLVRILLAFFFIAMWLVLLVVIERAFHKVSIRENLHCVLKQFTAQALMWIINGISFYVLLPGTGALEDLFFSIGAFGASFLAGYVAIFAPGGIGVREYVTTVLFSIAYGGVEIGILTIVHRLLYTISEFLLAGIAYLMPNARKSPAILESELNEHP